MPRFGTIPHVINVLNHSLSNCLEFNPGCELRLPQPLRGLCASGGPNRQVKHRKLRYFPGLRIRIHFIRIRIQHFRLNTNPDPDPIRIQGFNDQKLKKKLQLKKNVFDQKLQFTYLSLGLHKVCPSHRRSLQLSKEAIQHFKT